MGIGVSKRPHTVVCKVYTTLGGNVCGCVRACVRACVRVCVCVICGIVIFSLVYVFPTVLNHICYFVLFFNYSVEDFDVSCF